MKVVVTGGTGFIGSNLAEMLVSKGHEVVVIDNFSLGTMGNISRIKDKVRVMNGDIRDEKLVFEATKDADVIFNQAAASSSPMFMKNLREAVSVNVDGFNNILNAAVKNNVKRVIYASTSVIYGNKNKPLREDMKVSPPNFYSATKLMNENMAIIFGQEYGLESIGFRYMSVYGPHEESKKIYANLVSQFMWAMKKGVQPVIYGDGSQTRDFIYVKDVAAANIMAMESGKRHIGEVLNLGTGFALSLNDLVSILNKMLGTSIKAKYVSMPVKNYMMSQKADMNKTKKAIGFVPSFTLEEGIKDMISN